MLLCICDGFLVCLKYPSEHNSLHQGLYYIVYLWYCIDFYLISLFNGISTFVGYFNTKAILVEEQQWYYLTCSWENKRVIPFPKVLLKKWMWHQNLSLNSLISRLQSIILAIRLQVLLLHWFLIILQ